MLNYILLATLGGLCVLELITQSKRKTALKELVAVHNGHVKALQDHIAMLTQQRDAYYAVCEKQQLQIDALMDEFCPERMDPNQREYWTGHRHRTRSH